MPRAALIVGVNYYLKKPLTCCVNDAKEVSRLLQYHENGEQNFQVKTICAEDKTSPVLSHKLLKEIKDLFNNKHNNIALLYFSGHGGMTTQNGGYLVTSDSTSLQTTINMSELIEIVNNSPVENKIIIMDTCHSGDLGNHPSFSSNISFIGEGVTILTASSKEQVSLENPSSSHGVFTKLLVDALEGGAASIIGQITPGTIYSHIDKALGNFGQRPIFKTNTNRFIEIRKVKPAVDITELRKISQIFKYEDEEFQLDQSYELDSNVPKEYIPKKICIPENNEIFRILQNLNRVSIILPVGTNDMYFAAMDEKACKLTPLGKYYWNLSNEGKI